MKFRYKVAVAGDGRISRAVLHFFNRQNRDIRAFPLENEKDLRNADLITGALAGEIGERCLDLALKYRKDLVDVSDVDPEIYQARGKEIGKSGITVIPGCGFCPGIVNFLLGRETCSPVRVLEIHVKAGSLSPQGDYFPFLWCFEDLILEHRLVSSQIISGRKKRFPAFAGYRREKYFGIEAESYYSASGFENILDKTGARSLTCRVVRPSGFAAFFRFSESYGLFSPERMAESKAFLERIRRANYTLGEVEVVFPGKRIVWFLKSFSAAREKWNSMQKITASVPAAVGRLLLDGKIERKGLVFLEDLAADKTIFQALIDGVKKQGVTIVRREKRNA